VADGGSSSRRSFGRNLFAAEEGKKNMPPWDDLRGRRLLPREVGERRATLGQLWLRAV